MPVDPLDGIVERLRPSQAVLALARSVEPRPGLRVLDLGCGNGVLGALLLAREPTLEIVGVELSPTAARLAAHYHQVILGDLRDAERFLAPAWADVVLANPPFYPVGKGRLPPNPDRATARHEIHVALPQVVAAAAAVLNANGLMHLLHPTARQDDLEHALRLNGMQARAIDKVDDRACVTRAFNVTL